MNGGAWFGSMAGRMFLILLVGIVAAASLAFTVSDIQRRQDERRSREQRIVDRVSDLAQYLASAPANQRPEVLGHGPEAPRWAVASMPVGPLDTRLTGRIAGRLGVAAHAVAGRPSAAACRAARAQVGPMAPPRPPPPAHAPVAPDGPAPAALHGPPPPPSCRLVGLTLASGERVAFVLPSPPRPPAPPRGPLTPAFLAVLAAAAAALAYAVARIATAPLRRLSKAAVDLGRNLDGRPLPREGPTEVRQAADAFNAMQVRLKRDMSERTYMLAAITHDLRTPMTRQRLRLEKVADPDLRAQLLSDQAAMLEMIRDGLDLARASSDGEAMRELDVDSLLHSLCEDAASAGADVAIAARCDCTVRTRPQALRRCVGNLLDNALKYAGSAELSATADRGTVVIAVSDRGPGIAADQIDRVTEPFVRLESSRSRDTGGVGLGLTVARLLAERSGGSLRLSNRPGGGLDACVVLQQ